MCYDVLVPEKGPSAVTVIETGNAIRLSWQVL